MKTHTIRNKSSVPIITLTPEFFDVIIECHMEAVSLALSWFQKSYKNLTGKTPHLDRGQHCIILEKNGVNDQWVSKFSKLDLIPYSILRAFQDGLSNSISHDFETVLRVAEEFYSVMDSTYFKEL